VVSEVGRPDDGTDTGGFGNTEYFVDLKPHDQWRPIFHKYREELIAAMNLAVQKYPGAIWNFSQPIEDNVGETLTGTKGQLALKVFGSDLKTLEQKGEQVLLVTSLILFAGFLSPLRAQEVDAYLGFGTARDGSTGRSFSTQGDQTLRPAPSMGGIFPDFAAPHHTIS
jgi:hypothetical protein